MIEKPHICFVAPTAYPAVSGDESIEIIGGAQIQQAIVAKELVRAGYQVSMICMDHGQPDRLVIDGVTIHKAYKPDAGIPVMRFFWPRLTSIWRCLEKANADVYYYRAAGMLAGVVAAYCKCRGKRSIYAVAGDPDLEPNTTRIKYKRDRLMFEYGVRNVDRIIVQNDYQRALCIQNYGRDPVLISNCWPPVSNSRRTRSYVLWVSMIRELKRPHLFVDLAKSLPNCNFRMVGGSNPGEEKLFRSVREYSSTAPNLEFCGFIPQSRVGRFFDGARLLVNTSTSEGFPNTFLQAWARGIPTVSFVDCGARGDDGPIGIVADTLNDMRELIDELMIDDQRWTIRSEACLRHFAATHSPHAVIPQYEAVLQDLLQSSKRS